MKTKGVVCVTFGGCRMRRMRRTRHDRHANRRALSISEGDARAEKARESATTTTTTSRNYRRTWWCSFMVRDSVFVKIARARVPRTFSRMRILFYYTGAGCARALAKAMPAGRRAVARRRWVERDASAIYIHIFYITQSIWHIIVAKHKRHKCCLRRALCNRLYGRRRRCTVLYTRIIAPWCACSNGQQRKRARERERRARSVRFHFRCTHRRRAVSER